MLSPSTILSDIPLHLRNPLLKEYNSIVQNYMERRWSPSELSGGLFCEIVYTIITGHASGTYASKPQKPRDFVTACRSLESNTRGPRSFRILIPRMLPALYEIRNNRGVGHTGSDVDPNHMDATAVLSMSSWVLAELVRVFHNIDINEAQTVVDSLIERRVPWVWSKGSIKRVLDPSLSLKDQILLLLSSAPTSINVGDMLNWTECKNKKYFITVIRELHKERFLEFDENKADLTILPTGSDYIIEKIRKIKRSV